MIGDYVIVLKCMVLILMLFFCCRYYLESEGCWVFVILFNGYIIDYWCWWDLGIYEIVLGGEFWRKIRFLWDKEDYV